MRVGFTSWWRPSYRRLRLPIFDIELINIASPTFRIVIATMGFQMAIHIKKPKYWFKCRGGKGG